MVLLRRGLKMTAQETGAEVHLAKEAIWWTATLSSKVNFPDKINVKAVCGTDLVTESSTCSGNATLEVHRVYLTQNTY